MYLDVPITEGAIGTLVRHGTMQAWIAFPATRFSYGQAPGGLFELPLPFP